MTGISAASYSLDLDLEDMPVLAMIATLALDHPDVDADETKLAKHLLACIPLEFHPVAASRGVDEGEQHE